MMKGKIKDFFTIGGGNGGLTEEFIYNNQALNENNEVAVLSGSTIEKNQLRNIDVHSKLIIKTKEKDLKVYKGEGLKIVRKGLAGNISYYNSNLVTINDDAYFMQVKPKYKKEINIRFVEVAFKGIIKECITSDKGGNQTFSKTLFNEKEIEIPSKVNQDILVNELIKLENIYSQLEVKATQISQILLKTPSTIHGEYKEIDEIFDLIPEDRRLTEEFIYNNQGEYPVYSAQKNGAYGYVNFYSYEGELINVVQYGDSGKVFYREGKLNIGRNTCGLVPKEEFKYKVNLKYMKYALEQAFILNSKGDGLKSLSQGTIKRTMLYLPDILEQNTIAKEYERLESIKEQIELIQSKIKNAIN